MSEQQVERSEKRAKAKAKAGALACTHSSLLSTRSSLKRSSQAGYTLIEVIVAFALLALALTLLLGSLSGAARQVRRAEETTRATLHAQSLLAQVGVGEALQEGQRHGEFDGGRFRWNLRIAPYVDPNKTPANDIPSAMQLLQLDLDMQWGEAADQRLRWRTLRLAPPATGMAPP